MKKKSLWLAFRSTFVRFGFISPAPSLVKELVLKGEEGWVDIQLSISQVEQTQEHTRYTVLSSYQGDLVGLIIGVPNSSVDEKGFGKGFVLQSSGAPSHRLLHLLARLYAVPIDPNTQFASLRPVSYVDLYVFGNAVTGRQDPPSSTQMYKLFLEKDEEIYAEVFINVNPDEQWAAILEKDIDFRESLLQFLADPN